MPNLVILSILKPLFLVAALFYLWRSVPFIRGSRLEGIFISLGVFIVILFISSLEYVASVPEYFDVNVGRIDVSFLIEWAGYLVLIVCGYFIYRNYRRSFVSNWEKLFVVVLLFFTLAMVYGIFKNLEYFFGVDVYVVKMCVLIGMGFFVAVILVPTYVNYFGSRFFFPWCRIGGAMTLLTAVNYLQMVVETRSLGPLLVPMTEIFRTFSFWLLAIGFFTHYRAHARLTLPAHKYVERESFSEREALEQVFAYFVESLFALYGGVYGSRNERGLEKKWNALALREREAIRINRGKLENVKGPVELLRQAERLKKFLDLTFDLLVYYCGKPFVEKMMAQLCQELYWGEKELADNHFFSKLPWATALLSGAEEKEVSLEELLKALPIFYNLNREEIEFLKVHFKRKVFRAGKKIIREGERGDNFYVIVSGECHVFKRKGWGRKMVACLRRGDFFGEKALLENSPRAATLVAAKPVVVYALSKEDFLQILKTHFDLLQKMEPFEKTIDFLSAIPLFTLFSKMQLLYMASKMRPRQVPAGAMVVRQGDPGESFFVIEKGEVEVLAKGPEGEPRTIARLGRGECFGEIALIQPGGRTADVRALTAVTCWELSKEEFDKLFSGCVYNHKKLEKVILRRKEDLEKKLR